MSEYEEVTHDKLGRMNYHPEYHDNHKKDWTTHDEKYLIENYVSMGADHVSFTLGRTIGSIMNRAGEIRAQGRMPRRPKGAVYMPRVRNL